MYKLAILIVTAAAGISAATSSFAGMNDERVQKRDEIWNVETLDRNAYENKAPGAYSSEEILPERQDRHRVMG